jgi:hypothetical protein
MSTQEANMSRAISGQQTSDSGTGVDWESIWDDSSREPFEEIGPSKLASLTFVNTSASDVETAGEMVNNAVENGELERGDGGYHVAGWETPEETAEDVADETTHEQDDGRNRDNRGSEPTTDAEYEVQAIHNRMDAMSTKISNLEEENRDLKIALATLLEPQSDAVVVSEMHDIARKRGKQLQRTNNIVSKLSKQIEELGDMDSSESKSTKSRVLALRQYLVEQAEDADGSYGMDYNAVHSFFKGEIGTSWAHTVMTYAADGQGEETEDGINAHPAFSIQQGRSGNKQIRVDTDKIDEASILRPKKDREEEEA